MTLQQARKHFGTYASLARALKITKGAITQWDGVIPEAKQIQIHQITGGALRADPWIVRKYQHLQSAA